MAAAGGVATAALAEAAKLSPGQGRLNLWAFVTRDKALEALERTRAGLGLEALERTRAGLGLDYSHRINNRWAAFGQGWAGYDAGYDAGWGGGIMAGLRGEF